MPRELRNDGLDDPYTIALFEVVRQERRHWTRTIEKATTPHWKQFLDETGEKKATESGNIHENTRPFGLYTCPQSGQPRGDR